MAHGDAREGKWRGNWRMEWVASTLTRPRNVVYPPLLTLMRTPRLPAVDWTDSPADLNGLVRLGERRNLVSARVPSGSARALILVMDCILLHWVSLLVEILIVVFLVWHRAVLYVAWHQCQTWNSSFDPEDGGSVCLRNLFSTYNATQCQDPGHNLNNLCLMNQ